MRSEIKQNCKCLSTKQMIKDGMIYHIDHPIANGFIYVYKKNMSVEINNCPQCDKLLYTVFKSKSTDLETENAELKKEIEENTKYWDKVVKRINEAWKLSLKNYDNKIERLVNKLTAKEKPKEDFVGLTECYDFWDCNDLPHSDMLLAKSINKLIRAVKELQEGK